MTNPRTLKQFDDQYFERAVERLSIDRFYVCLMLGTGTQRVLYLREFWTLPQLIFFGERVVCHAK